MNPDADVTYQRFNLFSSKKCFICFIFDVRHYIRHNTICTILVKVDVLDTCGAIVFLLFSMKIESAVYTSFQNSTLLFINELIFDIMNIQDNQSLEFEWIPMLARIRFVNDWRFFMAYNNSLKSFQDWLNSVQHCQENFKRYWPKNCGKHMKYWKSALIKSLKPPNFFFNVRLSV